jgi:hypothetical protein
LTIPISQGRSPRSNVPAEVLSDSLGARVPSRLDIARNYPALAGTGLPARCYRAPISGQR